MNRTVSYREAHVVATEQVTPHMRRITVEGDLTKMVSAGPDQFVKLFLARDGGRPQVPAMTPDGDLMTWYRQYLAIPEPERPWMRSYTVRRFLPEHGRLQIDFALHDGTHAGPASRWARAARPGDVLGLAGPQASHRRVPEGGAWRLLVGDETALPAIGALVESLEPGQRADVYAEVDDAVEEQTWATAGEVTAHWVHRSEHGGHYGFGLLETLGAARLAHGAPFVWVAGEATLVRSVRRHLVEVRGHEPRSVAISAYWRANLTEDDPPTDQDLAERAELVAEMAQGTGSGRS